MGDTETFEEEVRMTSENFDTVLNSLREFRPYRVFTVELNGGDRFEIDHRAH